MSVPSWAYRGAHVECVRWGAEDDAVAGMFSLVPLVFGARYVIRDAVMRNGGPALLLEGISNEGSAWFDFEMAYDVNRFRPVKADDGEIETVLYRRKKHKHSQRIPHLGTVS